MITFKPYWWKWCILSRNQLPALTWDGGDWYVACDFSCGANAEWGGSDEAPTSNLEDPAPCVQIADIWTIQQRSDLLNLFPAFRSPLRFVIWLLVLVQLLGSRPQGWTVRQPYGLAIGKMIIMELMIFALDVHFSTQWFHSGGWSLVAQPGGKTRVVFWDKCFKRLEQSRPWRYRFIVIWKQVNVKFSHKYSVAKTSLEVFQHCAQDSRSTFNQ